MKKVENIDLGSDRILSIAENCIENKDYIVALKMLNKNSVVNGNDADSYMLYAEAFDDLYLSKKCINYWFRYLDYAGDDADLMEAYEGIAVNYMRLDDESSASYYFDLLLRETAPMLNDDERVKEVKHIVSEKRGMPHFVYPASLEDCSEKVEEAITLISFNNLEGAISLLEEIPSDNRDYLTARNYIAMTYVLSNDLDAAEAECRSILEKAPDNLHALSTMVTIQGARKDTEGARKTAEMLLDAKTDSDDDWFKIAAVCCEVGMHKEALDIYRRIEDSQYGLECPYLFFRAIAEYNCGMTEKSLETFDKLLTIYPLATAADYWRARIVKLSKKNVENRKATLKYIYHIPSSELKRRMRYLSVYSVLKDEDISDELKDDPLLSECMRTYFDEGLTEMNLGAKFLCTTCAVKAGLDDVLRDILLDAFLPEVLKIQTLQTIAETNKGGEYGVVIAGRYRRITLVPLSIWDRCGKVFRAAYCHLMFHINLIEPGSAQTLARVAEQLYFDLEARGALGVSQSQSAYVIAIMKLAGVLARFEKRGDDIYSALHTNRRTVDKILKAACSALPSEEEAAVSDGESENSDGGENE